MKILVFSKYLARALVYSKMVELYYLCVDNRNYRTAVHLKSVSTLFNNYSKNARLLPLSPHPSNNVVFHQVGGFSLTCTKNSEELLHFQTYSSERRKVEYFIFCIDYIL